MPCTKQPSHPTPPPPRPPFQFTLPTLLLLFVVLGASMAVFGAGGTVVFAVVVAVAVYLHFSWSPQGIGCLVLGRRGRPMSRLNGLQVR